MPATDFPPDNNIIKMEAGKGIEPYLRRVYEAAGFEVTAGTGERFQIPGTPMTGEYDWLAKDGETYLVDSKFLGYYGYIKILCLGVEVGDPGYYMQMQSYLMGLPDCEGAVLHCTVQDWSAANKLWRQGQHQWGKQTEDLPEFFVRYIARDEGNQYEAKIRSEEVKYLVDTVNDISQVRREFNPLKDKFPCGYCRIQTACIEAG